MVISRDKPFTPCDRYHPDYILRVKHLTTDLSRPPHKVKTPMITTSDVS